MEEYNIEAETGMRTKKGNSNFTRTQPTKPVLVKIPEFYYKVEKSGTIFRYYVADGPVDEFHLHPGSGCYVARYEAIGSNNSSLGSFLGSYSSTLAPSTRQTRYTYRTRARNMASGFQLYDFAAWCAVGLLYLVEFADWDSQKKMGQGIVNDTAAHKTGETDAMVYHTGRANSGDNAAVQYRGIENPWGNVWEWIDGINSSNDRPYICINPEQYADDTTANYTLSGVTLPASGYIKGLGFSSTFPWAFLPDANGGSNTTYIPDGVLSSSSWRVLRIGGDYVGGSEAGLFCLYANNYSSGVGANIGARLQFREVKT